MATHSDTEMTQQETENGKPEQRSESLGGGK